MDAENRRNYRHGLSRMKKAVSRLGSRAIDGRYRVSKALAQWRNELIQDLGGEESISTQQRTIIELASTSKLLLGSIDAWLLSQPSLFTRKKTLLPVVLQRQTLADGLARYLGQLGLQRRVKTPSLADLLNQQGDNQERSDTSNGIAEHEIVRQ